MTKKITLNGRVIEYELNRKNVKNLNLRIKADGTVHVSASPKVSQEKIDAFLYEHSEFITDAIEKYKELERLKPQKRELVTGEQIKILGAERILNVQNGKKNSVTCDKYTLMLTVKDVNDFELKKKVFEKWEKEQAALLITEICEAMYPHFENYVCEYPQIKFRRMTSRWGSCQPKNNVLTFNTMLIETPVECIEYVVAHEFTHFLEPNHSKNFYSKLERIIPDWKARKNKLNGR